MQTNLLSTKTNATSIKMLDKIDHPKLCQWLSAVAISRDKQAFSNLFKVFAPKILGIARSKFSNEAQANEVVQETMTNVWRKAHLFNQDKGAATTWVFTIMRNVSFDMLRKVKSNREDSLSEDIWPLVENEYSQDECYDDHLEHRKLIDVIEQLPVLQKEVIKGFYFMELSQEQLARQLNLPLGTIKSRLRLGLAKLRAQLGEHHG